MKENSTRNIKVRREHKVGGVCSKVHKPAKQDSKDNSFSLSKLSPLQRQLYFEEKDRLYCLYHIRFIGLYQMFTSDFNLYLDGIAQIQHIPLRDIIEICNRLLKTDSIDSLFIYNVLYYVCACEWVDGFSTMVSSADTVEFQNKYKQLIACSVELDEDYYETTLQIAAIYFHKYRWNIKVINGCATADDAKYILKCV